MAAPRAHRAHLAIDRVTGLAGEVQTNLVDQTGVGRAVFDLFRAIAGVRPIGITITGGDGETDAGGGQYRVAKLQLISRLEAELHTGTLKVASQVEAAAELKHELASFERHITPSGVARFEARVGANDDLVLAVALATWWLRRRSQSSASGWGIEAPPRLRPLLLTVGRRAMAEAMIRPEPEEAKERGRKGGRGKKAADIGGVSVSHQRLAEAREVLAADAKVARQVVAGGLCQDLPHPPEATATAAYTAASVSVRRSVHQNCYVSWPFSEEVTRCSRPA